MSKKKKLVVLVTACVTAVAVLVCGLTLMQRRKAMNETLAQVGWYDTEEKEFTITTVDELYDLAALSEYFDFAGQTVYLGNDIEVNSGDASEWAVHVPEKIWTPIEGFAGTFDGQGNTISGIYAVGINESVGLFTDTETSCVIQDFRLENSYIKGMSDKGTGSIVGKGSGTLEQIYSNAIVECQSDNCGGLVGYMRDGKTNTLQNCWFDGSVQGTSGTSSYVGGLVGRFLANSGISRLAHCLQTADVSAKSQYAGGFVGAITGETTLWITDSLSLGEVSANEGTSKAGMAVGSVFSQATLNVQTSWVKEGSYESKIGEAEGTVRGVCGSRAGDVLKGTSAYTNTTLDFEEFWAARENDTPILQCFTDEKADLTDVEKMIDVSWFDETATTLHIKTVAQLYGLQFLSQGYSFSGQIIYLDENLRLNEGNANEWAKFPPEHEWAPIGRHVDEEARTMGVVFAGTFDGQGHKISGLYMDINSTSAFAYGLFGKTSGVIKNLSLVNSYIGGTAGGNVGAVAASFAGGRMENVYSDAFVHVDANHVGGLVGRNESSATFDNCWFDGSVKAAERIGGIIGSMNNNSTVEIRHCLNSGKIHTTKYYAGGLTGLISNGEAIIEDSLNVGVITADKDSSWNGGITGVVNGKEGIGIKATFDNVYTLNTAYKQMYGLNGEDRTIIGPGGINLTEEELTDNNAYRWTNLDFINYWAATKDGMPVLKTFAKNTIPVSGSRLVDTNWYSVDGEDFEIDTPAKMRALIQLSRAYNFKDQTFKLTDDITLSEADWQPIGTHVEADGETTTGKAFAGTFDGQKHYISGMHMTLKGKEVAYGLFGQISGTVKNIYLKNSTVSGFGASAIGTVAGSLRDEGKLEYVYSSASVDVKAKYVGGIVGKIEKETTSTIKNAWFNGDAFGVNGVGGIVGWVTQGSELYMAHCLNEGFVLGTSDYIGGIVGVSDSANLSIIDSLNTGTVTASKGNDTGYYAAIIGGINGTKKAKKDEPQLEDVTVTLADAFYKRDGSLAGHKVIGANKDRLYLAGNGTISVAEEKLIGKNALEWTELNFKKHWTVRTENTPVLAAFSLDIINGDTSIDIDWYDPDETEFTITTVEQLKGLALLSQNYDFKGQTIKLGSDISLEGVDWQPIGTHVEVDGTTVGKVFAGTFDGDDYTISGLEMKLSGKEVAYGLFGQVSGTVENLCVKDSKITGKATSAVGSVAGALRDGGSLKNIYTDAKVDVNANYVGGLVGKIEADSDSEIINCWNDGNVSGKERVGGIVGYVSKDADLAILHCLNTGTINSTSEHYVSGICGLADQCTITITDCLNTGAITSDKGKLGYSGAILGAINGTKDESGRANINHAYYTKESCSKGTNVIAANAKYITVTGNGAISVEKANLIGTKALNCSTLDYQNYWTTVTSGTPILAYFAEKPVKAKAAIDTSWYDVSKTNFEIETKEQLLGLSMLSQIHDFAGQTFTVTADITLNDTTAADWTKNATSWQPIGTHVDENGNTIGKAFAGTFDGNGKKITGLYMKLTGKEVAYGLFGQVAGTVKNVTLESGVIEGTATSAVGSVAGSLRENGSLENIYSNVTVNVTGNYVGGIVGKTEANTTSSITNCWNAGAVSGSERVGGIVGYLSKGSEVTIEHCLNTGAISSGSQHYVSGICGLADQCTVVIKDCLNTGEVTTTANGGTLGYSGAILGAINGTADAKGAATINDVYYLNGSCTKGANVMAGNAAHITQQGTWPLLVTESQLTGENALTFTTLDFKESWATVENGYPVLAAFTDGGDNGESASADISWFDPKKDSFEIDTKEELLGLSLVAGTYDFAGKTITLTNTEAIDLSGVSWEPIGQHKDTTGTDVGKVFAGTFNGNGKEIKNLTISLPGTNARNYGLFGTVSGTIQNLKLTGVNITGTAAQQVGSVVGNLKGGTLENVSAEGKIKVTAHHIGGLVGICDGGTNVVSTITGCQFAGSIEQLGTDKSYTGGLVGYVNGTTLNMEHCLSDANVKSEGNFAGGVCGRITGNSIVTISDCLQVGTVTTKDANKGGIASQINNSKGTLRNVYYLSTGAEQPFSTSGTTTISGQGALSVTAAQLKGDEALNWTTLDFTNHWTVATNGYPVLYNKTDSEAARADISWYDVTDKTTDGLKIETKEQLWGLSLLSQYYDFADQTINLDEDITLNDTSTENWTANATSWNPIGYYESPAIGKAFAGTFNGANYTITGLNINVNNTTAKFYGLFGKVTGTIKNLSLKDVNITGTASNRIGGVAGSLAGGNLENVYCQGSINVTADVVGGLIGINESAASTITNSWFAGAVSGKSSIGGIAGQVSKELTISHCLNDAKVTSSSNYVGGMLGHVYKNSKVTIYDSLNTGDVTTTGTTSYIGEMIGCVRYKANVTLREVYYKDSAIERIYTTMESGQSITENIVRGLSTEELTGTNALDHTTLDFNQYWSAVEGSFPVLTTFKENTTGTVIENLSSKNDISWFTTGENDGSEEKPYIVDSKEDLYGFAFLSESENFDGKRIKLGDDIELSSDNWKPIGRYTTKSGNTTTNFGEIFNGTFDGQGYTISNLKIDLDDTTLQDYGLFGTVSGTIKNLKLTNVSITGKARQQIGSVVGQLQGGTLDTVSSEGTINIQANHLGGLVGYCYGSDSESTITNCQFVGCLNKTDGLYAGGIVGTVQKPLKISHCLNNAEIISNTTTNKDNVGGLCGRITANVNISDCLNIEKITATSTKTTLYSGAIAGLIDGSAKVTLEKVYYLTSSSNAYTKGNKATVSGNATSVTAEMLTGSEASNNTELDFENYWSVVDDGYPVLKAFEETSTANIASYTLKKSTSDAATEPAGEEAVTPDANSPAEGEAGTGEEQQTPTTGTGEAGTGEAGTGEEQQTPTPGAEQQTPAPGTDGASTGEAAAGETTTPDANIPTAGETGTGEAATDESEAGAGKEQSDAGNTDGSGSEEGAAGTDATNPQ